MSKAELWGRMDMRAFMSPIDPLPQLTPFDIDMLDFDLANSGNNLPLDLPTPPAERGIDFNQSLVAYNNNNNSSSHHNSIVNYNNNGVSERPHCMYGRRRSLSITSRGPNGWEASFVASQSYFVPNPAFGFDPNFTFGPGPEIFFPGYARESPMKPSPPTLSPDHQEIMYTDNYPSHHIAQQETVKEYPAITEGELHSPVNHEIPLSVPPEYHLSGVRADGLGKGFTIKRTEGMGKMDIGHTGHPEQTAVAPSKVGMGDPQAKRKYHSAQIEVIPCKVCGDKSSGVHYGVITCEGCKGFFRRSQAGPVNYQCPRNKNCVIDRVNRNRCQYCRLQKCIALGMSRDAVKFGRMSKKQRERVEDEVNMVKQGHLNGYGSPPHYSQHFNNNNNYTTFSEPQYQYPTNGVTTYPSPPPQGYTPTAIEVTTYQTVTPTAPHPVTLVKAVDVMDHGTFGKAIAEAHIRTYLYTEDQVQTMRRQPVSEEEISAYRNMTHRELWNQVAEKVTLAVQQIIEFAKMVPGFMDLSQDDQIMLLKAGSFELALIRLVQAYDVPSNTVIFGNSFVPLEAFAALNDEELKLMQEIFHFAKELQCLELTETELALLSALVLITGDRPGLKEVADIQKLREKITSSLKMEIGLNHPGNEELVSKVFHQIPLMRSLSSQHVNVLNKFKQTEPDMEFPALHKELFSIESTESS